MPSLSAEQLAQAFVNFAPNCLPSSPLYALLATSSAGDADLLALAAAVRPGQPPANMLLAAAHSLLLAGVPHPLAAYYPSCGGHAPPDQAAFAAFRDLCLTNTGALRHLLQTRLTQTNETRRCAYLLPAFQMVAARSRQPLALIEVGPSAGLNMLWDRYAYDYGDGRVVGDPGSPVRIATELRGPLRPPIPARLPEVAWRVGVDLNPLDLEDAEVRRWLEALVWPENLERRDRLRTAIGVARAARPPVLAGDALALLPELLGQAPTGAAVCVYHTHVTYQFSPAMRSELDALLQAAGRRRPIYRLSCEEQGSEPPRLVLSEYSAGGRADRLLASTTGHAHWLAWEDDAGLE